MTAQQPVEPKAASPRDTLMLMLSVAAMVGGVFAFYYFVGDYGTPVRAAMVIGGVAASLALAYPTEAGRQMLGYVRGASVELRKTTWPTRQESLQATLMIAIVVFIAAILFWSLDSVLLLGVKAVTGQH